ncbi:MAG: hypothetical protein R3C45_08610 [Phycisphaerales bacterium]
MPIRFRCQDCRSRVKVPEGTQGKQVKCPRCGRIQSVPRHHSQALEDAEPLTVHTLVGSMHQSPKRKEALVGGNNGYNHYESRGGGAPGGLDIPEEAADSGYTNHKHDRMSRKQRRRMEARAREAELARQAAADREAETLDQDAINESRKRVADLFATSESKSFDEAQTESAPITPLVAETARTATPPKAIAFAGNGSAVKHEEPVVAGTETVSVKPTHVVESAAQQSAEQDDAPDAPEQETRWTFDMTSDAYPFLKVIPWVLRITALMLIGPAFKVMLVADAQGFSGVVSLLVLFMGLALVVVTWTVGEIATAVRDIALKKATG